ncbi:MAG: 3'(2'),5'-bisphosphate nucleotidase CysQ, partial [Pseudohongiellaceae bacterium]
MTQDWILDEVVRIARLAGQEILEVYASNALAVEYKLDSSPLTEADRRANDLIVNELSRITPDVPILSEESAQVPFGIRKEWSRFWLVDPLDGTREFIKRNGEFTVNIALIENNRPVLGVVQVPVTDQCYVGCMSNSDG